MCLISWAQVNLTYFTCCDDMCSRENHMFDLFILHDGLSRTKIKFHLDYSRV